MHSAKPVVEYFDSEESTSAATSKSATSFSSGSVAVASNRGEEVIICPWHSYRIKLSTGEVFRIESYFCNLTHF